VHGKSTVVGTVLVKVTKPGKHSIKLSTRFAGHTLGKGAYTLSLQTGTGKNTSKAVTTKLHVRSSAGPPYSDSLPERSHTPDTA
jgi:hypothetical protein